MILDGFIRDIEIGNKAVSTYDRISYRNSPLAPGTKYQLAVAAVNEVGPRDLYYSEPFETMSEVNTEVIAATVVPIRSVDMKVSILVR